MTSNLGFCVRPESGILKPWEWGFGIVAVSTEGPERILHGVLYPDPPSNADMDELKSELESDEDLDMIGKNYNLMLATDIEVADMQKVMWEAMNGKTN